MTEPRYNREDFRLDIEGDRLTIHRAGFRFVFEGERLTIRLNPWTYIPGIAFCAAVLIFMLCLCGLLVGNADEDDSITRVVSGIGFFGGIGLLFGVFAWGLLSESRNRTLDRGSDSYKRVKVQLCHLRDVREIVIKPIVQKYRKMPFWSWVDYCVSVYVSKLGADQAQRLVEVDQFYIQGRTAFPEGRLFPGSLVLPGMREKAREVAEVIAKFTGVSVLEHRIDEGASVRQPP